MGMLALVGGLSPGVACADPGPVGPTDYANTTGGHKQFYTSTNINCVLNDDSIVCILDPSNGPGADMNIAMVSPEGSWTTWSATQARIFGPPDRPFDASKYGRPLKAGNAIAAGGGQCSLSQASVLECRRGESGFVIDSAGIRVY
ncbi:hypothetical protein [Mycobacteroides franklinii]|uniref:Uncharacterized protein n=1 Tax=Mycobacteroides franklinii TaxID=948102 RepID=A0A4R5PGK0_9MYCO|nr:hypothetical protein [Mycobacteroides franklinii]TDH24864.1 hypothetical protein EJ571_02965 [Mycobacteroides franklinii]